MVCTEMPTHGQSRSLLHGCMCLRKEKCTAFSSASYGKWENRGGQGSCCLAEHSIPCQQHSIDSATQLEDCCMTLCDVMLLH